jgi:hypothetical protein
MENYKGEKDMPDFTNMEIIADALAVSKGQTTIEKIRALHERPKIGTKSREVLIHRGHVSEMVILHESKSWGEILGRGTIIPYKFEGSEESTEIFRLTAYHPVGMIAVSEREGIDVVSERKGIDAVSERKGIDIVSEREGIDIVSEREGIEFIYRTKDKVPVGNYFPTKEDDIYGKREINCA